MKNTIKKENKIKEQKIDKPVEEKKESKGSGLLMRTLAVLFAGSFLSHEKVIRQFPFFIFLVMIGILYITNSNNADRTIRDINRINKDLKELRSEYIITKAELMFLSKQSELAKVVSPMGIKEAMMPPYIIKKDSSIAIY